MLNANMHPAYLRLLTMQLRERGLDADAILLDAGLTWEQLASEQQQRDVAIFAKLAQLVQQHTSWPWAGLELGALGQVSIHGAVGHAAISSANLRQLLQTITNFAQLRANFFRFTFLEQAASSSLQIHEQQALGAARHFILDAVLATLLRMIETAVGKIFTQIQVALPFAEPSWAAQYSALGLTHLRFDSDCLTLTFPSALLALPCVTVDASSHALATQECERALAALAGSSYAQRVISVLQAAHQAHYPSLAELAQTLHVSERTLMRKLKLEGSSYQNLLDEQRKAAASWYLRHSHEAIELIAARLGYQDTSNFSRTFRRWFGVSPSAFRHRE